ncbi:MAG: ThiF family adenylyltransferase [Deltaproteobacteria bacterium]|nr:ThiF family adenylyltransferase [Deltaproteobacteria bacterium]
MDQERYSRQILFHGIGCSGQDALMKSCVAIVGCGALGSVTATYLARAGVGKIVIVDRDFVELNNLQRQILFDEEDAEQRKPKALAAAEKLGRANSTIQVQPIIADLYPGNAFELLGDADLIIDGTDNVETRYLINDTCLKLGIPWIYAGVIGSEGMTMSIIPGKTACFRCLLPEPPPPGSLPTCDTAGVLGAAVGVVSSFQACQAMKILTGHEIDNSILLVLDAWEGRFYTIRIDPNTDCPACTKGQFEFLQGTGFSEAFSLCGRNAVQIRPTRAAKLDLTRLRQQLAPLGKVVDHKFFISFTAGDYELIIFPEGRVMIKGTTDEGIARGLYAKYVGT